MMFAVPYAITVPYLECVCLPCAPVGGPEWSKVGAAIFGRSKRLALRLRLHRKASYAKYTSQGVFQEFS